MPAVVRGLGDLKVAHDLDGREVRRQGYLQLKNEVLPVLNSDNHFLYKSRRLGSSILCTCGGQGVTVGRHVYRKYTSTNMGNEVLVCYYLMKDGHHADNST